MPNSELYTTAKKMMTAGKGILASDESTQSANKSLSKNDIEPTEENRRRYRELFIGTEGIGKYLNGIILFDETIGQHDSNNISFIDILEKEKMLIGIKVDKGTREVPEFPGEKFTQGLDDLDKRLQEYYDMGARFAKWRSIFKISKKTPSEEVISINVKNMAMYASLCQKTNVVPIVEPEVLLDGDHSIRESYQANKMVLSELFSELDELRVDLKGLILKNSMIHHGKGSTEKATDAEIAKQTIACLKENVPTDVAGIVFLSGGQDADEATRHLNDLAKVENLPWELTFSFLRAIEGPPLEIWAGKDENVKKARVLFEQRLKEVTAASKGEL